MKGILYGVGVGPGDPELMTLKAARLIRENDVIAVPGKSAAGSAAYRIAVQSVPELSGKTLLAIDMPMTRDEDVLHEAHQSGARGIAGYLERGMNVVYLTLGDPTVYCSFSYLQHILENAGFEVRLISGVPSFCAAAARAGISLAEGEESIRIFPGTREEEILSAGPEETVIVMKAGRRLRSLAEKLEEGGRRIVAVSGCGMPGEKIYRGAAEVPENAGYFSIMAAKN